MADCIIRIHLPLKDNLTPDTTNTGHFDIQVIGNITLTIPVGEQNGKVYTNPIISYGRAGVAIFNNGNYILENNKMLCTITYSEAFFGFFESWLNQNCTYAKTDSGATGQCDIFSVSGEFAKYYIETHNCFAACAKWLEMMGSNTLMDIYEHFTYPNGREAAHDPLGYKNYIAWAMFKTYYTAWNFAQLKT